MMVQPEQMMRPMPPADERFDIFRVDDDAERAVCNQPQISHQKILPSEEFEAFAGVDELVGVNPQIVLGKASKGRSKVWARQ